MSWKIVKIAGDLVAITVLGAVVFLLAMMAAIGTVIVFFALAPYAHS